MGTKKGFTLAEILITLGVIGVVAAMTIPALLNNYYEKRTVSQLRETQSIMAQAIKMAEEEYGDLESWFEENASQKDKALKMGEYLKPFLKIALDCGVEDTESKCVVNDTYLQKNGLPRISYASEIFYKFYLLNGSSIILNYSDYVDNSIAQIYIDTNGKNKPNTWGKDLFMFEYSNNSLRPMGAPDSLFPYETDCKDKNSTGIGCAYYVLTQNNMNYLH